MAFKPFLNATLLALVLSIPAHAQTVAPERLTTPMEFAGALVGAEIMLIEYSKSRCGPLAGRRFGVQEALNIVVPYLSPTERVALNKYVRDKAPQLHHEYQRLTGESLRKMHKEGIPTKEACTVLINIYDKAYHRAKEALVTSR